jgi:hypothetical protein
MRHTPVIVVGLGLAALVVFPSPVNAQRLDLSISPSVIAFPSADPDTVPIISAVPVTIQYRIRVNNREPWHMTVLAGGDLISGESTVDISAVSWIATPAPPFRSGTLSKTVAQTLAAGVGNVVPVTNGSVTFRLANSWTYDAGIYTQVIIFTLSAP